MKKWIVGLACLGMLVTGAMGQDPAVWLNEINYDTPGTDSNEFVEIAGPSSVDLANFIIVLYNGSGGAVYNTFTLSGTIVDEGCGYGAMDFATPSIQNGPDGIALADVSGGVTTLVQFLSYEGSFTGVGGPADGVVSVDIGLQSTADTLQLGGTATNYSGFVWETNTMSQGTLNINQSITGCSPSAQTNVHFTVDAETVDENVGTVQITLLKTLPEGNVSGEVALSGSAVEGAGADYTIDTTNFTMNGTTTSAVLTVTVNDDVEQEVAETLILTLANLSGANTMLPSTFTLTINPSDIPTHAITIASYTNGTVTTTPATEAEEGEAVTINAVADSGYAVDTYTVVDSTNGSVSVTGGEFTMPADDVTVTVTFDVFTGSVFYISEIADPSNNAAQGRFVEMYNSSASSIDLAAGTWNLAKQVNGGTVYSYALTGTVAAMSTYVVADDTDFAIAYPSAPAGTPDQTQGNIGGNGDDGYYLYSGGDETSGTLEDAYGVIDEDGTGKDWNYENSRANRNTSSTAGNPTWTAADWTITDPATVADMTPGVYPDGPVVFSVNFDLSEGFTVDEGSSQALTATAANGTEPYTYSWESTLDTSDYTAVEGVLTILDTAPIGAYSATVEASDISPATVTNIINFSVVAPPVQYAITITPPSNGTVTTTPETEAAEGETVTVNATGASGYAVDTIEVNGGAVVVSGNTFTMPAAAVTVTVTFMEVVAEGIVDFRFNTAPYLPATAADSHLTVTDMALTAGTIETDISTGTYFPDPPYIEESAGWTATAQADAKAFIFTITPAAETSVTIDGISFNAYATSAGPSAFGFDIGGGTATYEVDAPSASLLAVSQAVVGVVSETGAIEIKIQGWLNGSRASSGGGIFRLDDVVIHGSVYSGPPVYGVSFDKANGFVVDEGTEDAVTATAVNGTGSYSYVWTSTLGTSYYETNAPNVFSILDTAPVGVYTTTVVAADSSAIPQLATNTISFNVVTPGVTNTITITAPVNGTVTTTPASEAESGATVTINATPIGGFQVDTITVVDGAMNPVAVVGNDFVMPASPVTVTVLFSLIPTGAEIVFDGALTGNVNELFSLTFSLTNSATPAANWGVDLKDPTNADVWTYTQPPSFSFTPTLVGDYSLTVTAVDTGGVPLASTNLMLTISSPASNPDIPSITFVAGTGFTFEVPIGFTLSKVEGAVTLLSGEAYNWLLLTEGAGNDYTLVGTTVTILDSATLPSGYGRMVRIWVTAD